MRLFALSAALVLMSFQAWANPPTMASAAGVSSFTTTGSPIIYGGFAGAPCTDGGANTATCNNCAAAVNACAGGTAPLCACNSARSYNALIVTISLNHDVAGQAIVTKTSSTTPVAIRNPGNDGGTVQITWADICQNFIDTTPSSDCEAAGTGTSGTMRIYIDKDRDNVVDSDEQYVDVAVRILRPDPAGNDYNVFGATRTDGISNFTPYPGDGKIYIEDPETQTGSGTLGYGGKLTKVRVFVAEGNMTNAHPEGGLTPEDLPVVENGTTLDNSVVDGLENDKEYYVRIASVDEANNVVQFFPAAGTESCDTGGACTYKVTPSEVLGLLTEDFNCFVASAAYGTSMNDKLDTFREFRFKRLLPHTWGRSFVKWYYHYGPYAARYIHDKPVMRAAARAFLWPAYGFSVMTLKYGWIKAGLFSLALITAMILLPLFWVRRQCKRE